MACTRPKLAYIIYGDDGKYHLSFHNRPPGDGWKPIAIPCGKCDGCISAKARQWAVRCQLEAKLYPGRCFFVTLTYDDDHVPLVDCAKVDKTTGEAVVRGIPTLRKKHLQDYHKRLREYDWFSPRLRFFASGEYGEKSGRPHYHEILFNVGFNDLQYFKSGDGVAYYTSEFLSKEWPYGQHLISDYSYATGAYVAKYISKSMMPVEKSVFDQREKPFLLMSRRPGIGRDALDAQKDAILATDKVYLPGEDGAITTYPPDYFTHFIRDTVDYEQHRLNKELRRDLSDLTRLAVERQSEKDWLSRLKDDEERNAQKRKLRDFN